MLIDGEIRNRLVSLADTVQETRLDLAFEAVLRGAAVRRRRALMTRLTVAGTALTVIVAGTTVGWSWRGDEQLQPQPVDQVDPVERQIEPRPPEWVQRPPEIPGRMRIGDRRDAGPAPRPRASREVDPEAPARKAKPRADAAGVSEAAPEVAPEQRDEAPVEDPVEYHVTHRESATYEWGSDHQLQSGAPLGCYRYTCREFESSAEDRFATVSVNDRSGPVMVRIIQSDRYGGVHPFTYCGGSTERFELVEGLAFFRVEVHNSDCDGGAPAGGDIQVTFFKREV